MATKKHKGHKLERSTKGGIVPLHSFVSFVHLTYMGEAVYSAKLGFAPLNDIAHVGAMAGHRLRCREW
jgi:hypothetical protein